MNWHTTTARVSVQSVSTYYKFDSFVDLSPYHLDLSIGVFAPRHQGAVALERHVQALVPTVDNPSLECRLRCALGATEAALPLHERARQLARLVGEQCRGFVVLPKAFEPHRLNRSP
jgi:hypothetical protein